MPPQTQLLTIDKFDANDSAWRQAITLLRQDEVIVAPTDTVYGVMCRYDRPAAVNRLYDIKQRPQHKAIPILIGETDQLEQVIGVTPSAVTLELIERYWPGPLTIILTAHSDLPPELTAGGSTVGVRMPAHPALCALMRHVGPLAATSANPSGAVEAVTAEQALESLHGLVPLILSDDAVANRPITPVPSTVVDLSTAEPAILRQGPIASQVLATLQTMGRTPC